MMRLKVYNKRLRKADGTSVAILAGLLFIILVASLMLAYEARSSQHSFQEKVQGFDQQQQDDHVIHKRSSEVQSAVIHGYLIVKYKANISLLDFQDDPPQTLQANIGITYVRWGRRDCPQNTNTGLVYHGYAGGSYYNHVGGGSDFVCLHHNVTYTAGHYIDGSTGSAWIYGVEYTDGSWARPLLDLSLIEEQSLQHQGVPCAVCLVRQSTAQLMIPSRETCPKDWKLEYTGYLMTGSSSVKHSSGFLCVDEQPQVIPGSKGIQHGAYLNIVQMDCGYNIPCEPYVDGREVRCVVCSLQN